MQRRRVTNAYIDVDVSRCVACGRCVTACKQDALELVGFKRVVHVHIARPKLCTGCLSCAAACREHAIQSVSAEGE